MGYRYHQTARFGLPIQKQSKMHLPWRWLQIPKRKQLTYLLFYNLNDFADKLTEKLANTTTDTELIGISIAATIGVRFPWTANDNPTRLYRNEIRNPALTMFMLRCVNSMNCASPENFFDWRMASQAGEKLNTLSAITIPTLLSLSAPASFSPSPIINTFLPSCFNNLM